MRPVDADALIEWFRPFLHEDEKIDPDTVISDIRAFPTIAPLPNDPLTLDELREMGGEPVWVHELTRRRLSGWALVYETIVEGVSRVYTLSSYGKNWLAYRRKPENTQS